MKKSTKAIELKFERTIPASPNEVYDAWLNANKNGGRRVDEGFAVLCVCSITEGVLE